MPCIIFKFINRLQFRRIVYSYKHEKRFFFVVVLLFGKFTKSSSLFATLINSRKSMVVFAFRMF